MKKKLMIILSAVMICTAIPLTACNKTPETDWDKSVQLSDNSSVSGDNSSVSAQIVDRSQYNYDALMAKLKDFDSQNGDDFVAHAQAVISEYKVGDVFNMLLEQYDKKLSINTDFKKGFGFSKYDDGYWRTNSNAKRAHKLIDAILDLNLDGEDKLEVSQSDLEIYKYTKLYSLLGYSQTVRDTITEINPSLNSLLDSSYGEIYDMINGVGEQKEQAQKSLLSKISLNDVLAVFDRKISDKTINLYDFIYVEKLPDGMTLAQILALDKSVREQELISVLESLLFDAVNWLDTYMGDDIMIDGKNWNVCFSFILRYINADIDERNTLEKDVENYILSSTFGSISDMANKIIAQNNQKLDELFVKYQLNVDCNAIKEFFNSDLFVKNSEMVIEEYVRNKTVSDFIGQSSQDFQSNAAVNDLKTQFGDYKIIELKSLDAEKKSTFDSILKKLAISYLIK